MKNNIIIPIALLFACGLKAQTGGPGQPEFMQFQQASTSNLVNPSTGSFSYQIPLFTIGGYPMNLIYQSGIQMEDVSTATGLGWNLNAGSVVRTLRGLQDDFQGDVITKKYSVKPNETYGGKLSVDWEIAGLPKHIGATMGVGLGVFYNNYKGWGLEPSVNGSISATTAKSNEGNGGSASLGMGMSANSQNGVDKYMSPSIGLKLGSGTDKLGISLGKTWSVNSNEGLKTSVNSGLSYTRYSANQTRKGNEGGYKTSERHTDQSSMPLLGFATDSYLNNTFQPDIEYPFENTSGSYSGTLGWDAYYLDPNIRVSGYFSKQKLTATSQDFGAYGAMYENSSISGKSLMDFNTEKKLPYFIGESKILPIPFKTPDIFNLNAQGLSMTFSVLKNDIGIVGDPDGMVSSSGNQGGVEVNLGQLFKAGANFGTTISSQSTQKYKWGLSGVDFHDTQTVSGGQLYQQFCFKNHGEINKFDHSAFAVLGGYEPIKFNLANESSLTNVMSNGTGISATAPLVNTNKPVRQSGINYLTATEASKIGFDKRIKYYHFNGQLDSIPRVSSARLGHHLSEMSIVQPDGMRYVFGLPVYNLTQKEASFNVSGNTPKDDLRNLVRYSGLDNSEGNQKGIDHFYESMTTPAYATQFLITAVLNTDYRDLTNNGISNDDLGNYVKFSYYKEDTNYRWRTPFAKDMATLNRGLRSDDMDDRGTYVYGEKELWYVRSMESKTEISMFHYSNRLDAFGVIDENGGLNTAMPLKKLDEIVVYSLRDYLQNGSSAIPIKTIHFTYNYTLCTNTENTAPANQSKGKLTLDKVYFNYENSQKGSLTPYEFAYGRKSATDIINPAYNQRSVNRWGYYQPDSGTYSDLYDAPSYALSNVDSPYSSQSKPAMDTNAYAWNLTDVKIPGGAKIKVNYEANDYAYIQDKTAGQMFKVTGVSNPASTSSGTGGNNLYDSQNPGDVKNRIYFALINPINNGSAAADRKELEDKYIKDIKSGFLYYKMYVKLKGTKYEYITGYAKVRDYGVTSNHGYGYLDLEPTGIDDENSQIKCNPILKTALQFMRINRNGMLFNSNTMGTPGSFDSFITSLPNILGQVGSQISASTMGVNKYCQTQHFCDEIVLDKSFIRLYNPTKTKIAGGSRVNQISINDNWDMMTFPSGMGKSYTTNYDYTTEETDAVPAANATPKKLTISSGVAEYEPMTGGDEISLKQPIFYSDIKKLAPDNDYYVEDPVNESLFPAPQIIYGKVTQITNGTTESVGKTGKIVNEFYTAKDFPVKVKRTEVDQARDKTEYNPIQIPFVAIDQQHDFAAVSQGFSIELNNMSGLAKATWVYNENGERISGEESKYYADNDHFTLINKTGNIFTNQRLGLSVEYTVGGKKSYDKSVSTIYNANLNVSMFGIFPIPIIMPLYSQMTDERQFQSIVVNKVIHRNALLKSKTVYEQSSCITTENLAFDEVTGEALLSKMDNEFNDPLYTFKYPAYWMYSGMGPSSDNTKLLLTNVSLYKPFLKVGDELRSVTTGFRMWVRSTALPTFENSTGMVTTPVLTDQYQIYSSGAKNLLTESAGQVVTWKQNPIQNMTTLNFGTGKTLNSSAKEYFEDAVMYCESCPAITSRFVKSDFLSGKKGNYKEKQSWFFQKDRTSANSSNGITDIKTQGLFTNYNDFWIRPSNIYSSWTKANTSWEWKEKVNLKDNDGQTIETEDRLGRKTASLLGYKNTLITAQAINSGYGEAYFDGFEDYYCAYCPYDPTVKRPLINEMKRVKIVSKNLVISGSESHTGKYSLEVSAPLVFTVSPPVPCAGRLAASSTPCLDCIGGFFPEKNKKYVFSCWVKVNSAPPILSCSGAVVTITAGGVTLATLHSEGAVIDDWQRVMGNFDLGTSNNVTVTLTMGTSTTYFDDLRIFPAEGNMASYIYDDVNLRLTYSLDENNYFTKNEYNNQGELIRIKKETEKGIITIKEGDSSLQKNQ